MRKQARKVIGVTNSRVVKVKEIYEQNTRGILSSSVYILCNILGEDSSKELDAVQVSMVDERCVLGFVWSAVQDIYFGLDLASRKQWFVAQEDIWCEQLVKR